MTNQEKHFILINQFQLNDLGNIALKSLEVYISIFEVTEEKNKIKLYTDTFDEFSFSELKDELEEILNVSNISSKHLEGNSIGPRINNAYRKIRLEKSSTDGYFIILLASARSPFGDFESCLRIVVKLDEDDIQLILKQYNSNFVTYEVSPGIYTIKNISEAVYTRGYYEGTLKIEYDDISMKTKLILTHFGSTFGTLRFDEKAFFKNFIGFKTILGLKT